VAAGAAADEDGPESGLEVTGEREGAPSERSGPEEGVEPVELDRLLQLPSSMSFDRQTRNGASSDDWRARFRASHKELRAAQAQVDATRKALDEAAGAGGSSQWQMGPPGANNTEVTPVSFKLREELRASRERLEEAERQHRELVIQADLAGVPDEWRQPE
jgi:hypothetical protein